MTCLYDIIMTTLPWLALMLLLWQPCYDLLSWKSYANLTLTCLNAIVMTTLLWLASNLLLWQHYRDLPSWYYYDNPTFTCLNAIVMTTLPWLASNILLWQPCQDIMVLRWKFKSSAICWPSGGVCIQCKTMTKSYLLIFDICLHPQLPNQSENSYNFFLCKKVAGKREITILRKSWQCLINLMSWYGNTGAY